MLQANVDVMCESKFLAAQAMTHKSWVYMAEHLCGKCKRQKCCSKSEWFVNPLLISH